MTNAERRKLNAIERTANAFQLAALIGASMLFTVVFWGKVLGAL